MAKKIYNDHINIDKKLWLEILSDEITDQDTLAILNVLLDSNEYEERGKVIGERLERDYRGLNGIIKSYGKRITDKYPKIKCPKYEDGRDARFHVPFLAEKKNGGWYWKLRPELVEALKAYKAE
jgi:hypothetical protein